MIVLPSRVNTRLPVKHPAAAISTRGSISSMAETISALATFDELTRMAAY